MTAISGPSVVRDEALERILYAGIRRPERVTAIMHNIGMRFSVHAAQGGKCVLPHGAWVDFTISLLRVERALALHGFVLRKSGGTPFDEIWLEPQGLAS